VVVPSVEHPSADNICDARLRRVVLNMVHRLRRQQNNRKRQSVSFTKEAFSLWNYANYDVIRINI
jgi:hypothetical protein